jgi:hypothetical protein
MSLGKADDNRIQETIEVLQKFVDQVSAIDIAKDVDVKDAYILGPVLVLDKVMDQYGHLFYPSTHCSTTSQIVLQLSKSRFFSHSISVCSARF